jgi:hypothetical protein
VRFGDKNNFFYSKKSHLPTKYTVGVVVVNSKVVGLAPGVNAAISQI